MTSAVTMSVMGNTKLVVLIGISMLTLERAPGLGAVAGVALALSGVFWYTAHRHFEARHKDAAAAREREAHVGGRAIGSGHGASAAGHPRTSAGEGTSLLGAAIGAGGGSGGAQPQSSTC